MPQKPFQWVSINVDMPEHPKTYKLAELLNIPDATAVGILTKLFTCAAKYAPDGDFGIPDLDWFAGRIGWEKDWGEPIGLIHALRTVGYLTADTDRIEIYEWAENQPYVRSLSQARRRKQDQRDREKAKEADASDDPDADPEMPMSRDCHVTQPDVTYGSRDVDKGTGEVLLTQPSTGEDTKGSGLPESEDEGTSRDTFCKGKEGKGKGKGKNITHVREFRGQGRVMIAFSDSQLEMLSLAASISVDEVIHYRTMYAERMAAGSKAGGLDPPQPSRAYRNILGLLMSETKRQSRASNKGQRTQRPKEL